MTIEIAHILHLLRAELEATMMLTGYAMRDDVRGALAR